MIKKLLVGLAVLSCTISHKAALPLRMERQQSIIWEVRQQEMKQHYPVWQWLSSDWSEAGR